MRTLFYTFLSLFFIAFFLLASCKNKKEEKQPVADFIMDKQVYTAGDTLKVTNLSLNSSVFSWTVIGNLLNSKDVNFITNDMAAGTFEIMLKASSASGQKSDMITKTFEMLPAFGELVLYDHSGIYSVTVRSYSIDYVGYTWPFTPPIYNEIPECGQDGFPTHTLRAGNYGVQYRDRGGTRGKSVIVRRNKCTKFAIDY